MSPESWRVVSLAEFLSTEFPPQEYLVDKLFYRADKVILSGQMKLAQKTWLAQIVAMVVASGRNLFGFNCNQQGRVLFIEEEGVEAAIQQRFVWLLNGLGEEDRIALIEILKSNFWISVLQEIKVDKPIWAGRILEFVEKNEIKLVVLDTLSLMHGCEENSKTEMGVVVDFLRKLSRLGCASISVHHMTKDLGRIKYADDSVLNDQIRGSSSLIGAADTHLAARRHDLSDVYVNLSVISRGAPHKWLLKWNISEAEKSATCIARERPSADIDLNDIVSQLQQTNRDISINTLVSLTKLSINRCKQLIELLELDGILTVKVPGELWTIKS